MKLKTVKTSTKNVNRNILRRCLCISLFIILKLKLMPVMLEDQIFTQRSGTKDKPVTKKITDTEYQPIIEAFENIDFQKVFKESGDSFGCDGWCLKVTISKIMSGISVSLWCPSKNSAIPETTKLLKACDKIFDFFPEEYRKC